MTQVIVAKTLKVDLKTEDVVQKTYQADESVRVELTFSKSQMELIAKAQALSSHLTGGDLKKTLLHVIEDFIQTKTKIKTKTKSKMTEPKQNTNFDNAKREANVNGSLPRWR